MDLRKLLRAAAPWAPSSATHHQHRQQLRTRWLDQIVQALATTTTTSSASNTTRGSVPTSASSLCFKCRVRTSTTGSTWTTGPIKTVQHLRLTESSIVPSSNTRMFTLHPSSSCRFYAVHHQSPQTQVATFTASHITSHSARSKQRSSPTKSGFYARSAARQSFRRRRSDALFHARHRRTAMLQVYSAPNAVPPLPRLRHRRLAAHQKERRRRDDQLLFNKNNNTINGLIEGNTSITTTIGHTRRDLSLTRQPYYHLKYRLRHRFPKRVRLLGFQHFLSRHTQSSKLYKLNLSKRIRDAQQRRKFQASKSRFSIRRRFVRTHLSWLDQLDLALAQHRSHTKAIPIARRLMMNKQAGVRQPTGAQFHKLVKLDKELYFRWTRSVSSSSISGAQKLPRRDIGAMLTTVDFNHILRECLDSGDTKNALSITRHLINRYTSPTFQLLDDQHAPPNTGVIYNMMRSLMADDHYQEALQLFQLVHRLFSGSSSLSSPTSKRLPLDLYNSFLEQLGDYQHFDEMHAVLQFLEQHGPRPTMHTYNVVLEAVATHGTDAQWEAAQALLDQRTASSSDIAFDQETYLVFAQRAIRRHHVTEALNWLTRMEQCGRGYKLTATLFDPLIRECIQRATKNLPHPRKGPLKRPRGAAIAVTDQQQSWIHASLQLFRVMTDRGLIPTVRTLDLLIEGFLHQRRLHEAEQVLDAMTTTFAYHHPTPRILTHFFDYHLGMKDYPAAIATLERIKSVTMATSATASFDHDNRDPSSQVMPRRKLYRDLLHCLVADRQWTLAERTLYDMTFTAGVVLTTEELARLLTKMIDAPDSIERILAIAGPVAPSVSRTIPSSPFNFLQEARITLMKAKSESPAQLERDEVWSMWLLTLKSAMDKRDFAIATILKDEKKNQMKLKKDGSMDGDRHHQSSVVSLKTLPLRALTSTEDEDRLVKAFASVARASRQPPSRLQQRKGEAPLSTSSSTWTVALDGTNSASRTVPSDWSFYPPRTPHIASTTTGASPSTSSKGGDPFLSSLSSSSSSSLSNAASPYNSSAILSTLISKKEQDAYLDTFIRSTRATLWNQLPTVQSRIRTAAAEILHQRRQRIELMAAQIQKAGGEAYTKEKQREELGEEVQRQRDKEMMDPLTKSRLSRLQSAYARIQALKVDLPTWATQAYIQSLESHGQLDAVKQARAKHSLSSSTSSTRHQQ